MCDRVSSGMCRNRQNAKSANQKNTGKQQERKKFKKPKKKFFQGLCDCTEAMSHCRTFEDPPIQVILANLQSVAMAKKIPAPFTLAKELRWVNSHVMYTLH